MDETREATCLRLQRAAVYDTLGDPQQALAELEQALALHRGGEDPVLSLALQHALVSFLADLGELELAAALFFSLEWMYEELGEELLRLRGAWLKGRLFLRVDGPERAVPILTAVRDALVERRLPYDAALAGLDLALALARCGRHREVMELAAEMVPVFAAQGIEEEARRALARWAEAARAERTDAEAIARLIEELRQIARRPLPLSPRAD